jgi:hypothetical protein
MRFYNIKNTIGLLILAVLVISILIPACRKDPEPLDRNRAPDTYLTSAPPETSNAEYKVHLYWSGEDKDGIVTKYIWYRSDTLRTLTPIEQPDLEILDWNPEARREDLIRGTYTTRTDTVIVFTGFDATRGVKVNRQAFHVAAVDDGGKIDKTPARIQFFAEVDCLPDVKYWYDSETIPSKPYMPGAYDTISMFESFNVQFIGNTCNDYINGYQWSYGGKVFPDFNNDGTPEWWIPEVSPPETLDVPFYNKDNEVLPEGDFFLRVIARDDAGGLSEADFASGMGVFRMVINHDPDTRILFGESFYTDLSGVMREDTIYFDESEPDTLPYNSRLRLHYLGWDDPRDSLEFTNPPIPMRFQFKFERWGEGISGGTSSNKPPWKPETDAEDTNCNSDEDSTTLRVGSFKYLFIAKSFDEQYRYDHTPDSVYFYGNFPPIIGNMEIGFDSIPFTPTLELHKIETDTLYIGLDRAYTPRGDTCSAYSRENDIENGLINLNYKFYILCNGRDDSRDPPGSGIKGWWFSIDNNDPDFFFRKEEEWLSEFDTDTMQQEVFFRLVVPVDPDSPPNYPSPDSSYVDNPPLWLGPQNLTIWASDLHVSEMFYEGIRGRSPVFVNDDPCEEVLQISDWDGQERNIANYARTDLKSIGFFIKLVY